jgi:hypothetical protein
LNREELLVLDTGMDDKPLEPRNRPWPGWIDWLIIILLCAVLVHTISRRGRREADREIPVRPAEMAVAVHRENLPEPATANTVTNFQSSSIPVPDTPDAAFDDTESIERAAEDESWFSPADMGVTGRVEDSFSVQATGVETTQRLAAATARQLELVEHARKTFVKKGDPKYTADRRLSEVSDTIAWFYFHYPSRDECIRLAGLCSEIEKENKHPENVLRAVEGSRYIFENELAMMDKGYKRYGRIWVDNNGMAQILLMVAERSRRIDEDLRWQQKQLERSASGSTARAKPPSAVPGLRDSGRSVKRIGDSPEGLKGPGRPIRRLGEDSSSGLKGPDRPIKRIGDGK